MRQISKNKGVVYCKKTIRDGKNMIRYTKGIEWEYIQHDSGHFSVMGLHSYSKQCTSQEKFFEVFGEYFETKEERRKRIIKNLWN